MKFSFFSNMYPSKQHPFYGTFVKAAYNSWTEVMNEEDIRKIVIRGKTVSKITKLSAYSLLYFKCIIDILIRRPNFYEIHYPLYFFPLLFLVKRHSVILRFHGSDLEKLKVNFLLNFCYKKNRNKIFTIICPSQYYSERVLKELDFEGNIRVIPPDCVDKIFYPKTTDNPDSTFTLGTVSRLDEDKNIQELLHALQIIDQKILFNLIIIGSGPYSKKLKLLTKELKLINKVQFLDAMPRESLADYMGGFDLFVFPSKRTAESFGLVGLESLACGVPVLVRGSLMGPKEYLNDTNSLSYDSSATDLANKIIQYQKFSLEEKTAYRNSALKTANEFSFNLRILPQIRILHKEMLSQHEKK